MLICGLSWRVGLKVNKCDVMKSEKTNKFAVKNGVFLIFTALLVFMSLLFAGVQAATYFSVKPDKELCTTIVFGQHGRGEYTLTAKEPVTGGGWIDNHFTSFVAGPDNIIVVPICFSAKGRKVGNQANIHVTVSTPSSGNLTYDYGICVSKYEDVDIVEGEATGDACDRMGGHTDIFSAALAQPERYADPGEIVTYTLVLDSGLPLTLEIAKGTEAMRITASKTSVEAGAGQQQVPLQIAAPSTAGDYDFIVMVSVQGCNIADCQKAVRGVLHVRKVAEKPQAGFYAWLTPETKSIIGQQSTMYVLKFQNYGDSQQLTASVSLEAGLESDFSPYSVYLSKGESKSITFTVRPTTTDRKTYKLSAVVTGDDGTKRSADAWLTVDEMVADASKLDQDGFIAEYDAGGGASLEDWEELRSVTGAAPAGGGEIPIGPEPAPGPNIFLWAVIGIVVVVIVLMIIIIYKKTMVEGGASWEGLGV